MVNCRTFATVCSIVCIASCAGSLFLLSTVHPREADNATAHMLNAEHLENNPDGNPLDSLAPFYRYRHKLVHKLVSGPDYALTTLAEPEEEEPLFIIPPDLIRNVSPPLIPSVANVTAVTSTITSTEVTLENEVNQNETLSDDDIRIILMPPTFNTSHSSPIKGHRRSVPYNKHRIMDSNASSIVMKILDTSGQSRIEIKINSNTQDTLRHKPDTAMIVQKDNESLDAFRLGRNTEVKILPNNTVVVKNMNRKPERFNTVSDTTKNFTVNNTFNVDNAHKLTSILDKVNKSVITNLSLKLKKSAGLSDNTTTNILSNTSIIHKNTSNIARISADSTTIPVYNITKDVNTNTSQFTKDSLNFTKLISRKFNYTRHPMINIIADDNKNISVFSSLNISATKHHGIKINDNNNSRSNISEVVTNVTRGENAHLQMTTQSLISDFNRFKTTTEKYISRRIINSSQVQTRSTAIFDRVNVTNERSRSFRYNSNVTLSTSGSTLTPHVLSTNETDFNDVLTGLTNKRVGV